MWHFFFVVVQLVLQQRTPMTPSIPSTPNTTTFCSVSSQRSRCAAADTAVDPCRTYKHNRNKTKTQPMLCVRKGAGIQSAAPAAKLQLANSWAAAARGAFDVAFAAGAAD
jgi:hypothetical protein